MEVESKLAVVTTFRLVEASEREVVKVEVPLLSSKASASSLSRVEATEVLSVVPSSVTVIVYATTRDNVASFLRTSSLLFG